jgi:hypothetical protein
MDRVRTLKKYLRVNRRKLEGEELDEMARRRAEGSVGDEA